MSEDLTAVQALSRDVAEMRSQLTRLDARAERLGAIEIALERLDRHVEANTTKVEAVAAETKADTSWTSVAIKWLGVPAIVMVMYLQMHQGREASASVDLKRAETAKTAVDELKTRAEIQQMLQDLEKKRTQNLVAYEDELRKTLPHLTQSLQKLQQLDAAAATTGRQRDLSRYMLIWIFLTALGLVFNILHTLWSPLVSAASGAWHSRQWSDSPRERRLRAVFNVLQPLLYPLPSIIHIAVEVSLFGAILIPLFNELAAQMGSPVTFGAIAKELSHLQFADAIQLVRGVVFGSHGSSATF